MKKVEISARTLSGTIGLIVCYSLSIWLFWDDQARMIYFRVLPSESHFSHFLMNFMQNDTARTLATIVAFASVHLSWSYRYLAGDLIGRFLRRHVLRNISGTEPAIRQGAHKVDDPAEPSGILIDHSSGHPDEMPDKTERLTRK